MVGPNFENHDVPSSFTDVTVQAPTATGVEDWRDPADPGTWRLKGEVAREPSSVDVPHVQHVLAAVSVDLLARTDTKELPVIELNEHGQPKTKPLPIITPEQQGEQ